MPPWWLRALHPAGGHFGPVSGLVYKPTSPPRHRSSSPRPLINSTHFFVEISPTPWFALLNHSRSRFRTYPSLLRLASGSSTGLRAVTPVAGNSTGSAKSIDDTHTSPTHTSSRHIDRHSLDEGIKLLLHL